MAPFIERFDPPLELRPMPSLVKPSTSFCGVASAAPDRLPADTVAAVIGAGYRLGSAHAGTENGPYFLRTVSKQHTWSAADPTILDLTSGGRPVLKRVVDLGDIELAGCASIAEILAQVMRVLMSLPQGVAPCLIGGDHTLTLPVVRFLRDTREMPFSVVHFDHHLDLQIWGAPASDAREPIFNTNVMSHVCDVVSPERVFQLGVGPYVTVESNAAEDVAILFGRLGAQISLVSPLLHDLQAMQGIFEESGDVYITVDLDVLGAESMTATAYPAVMGLTVKELLALIDVVLSRKRLIGFDVVEFGASRGDRDPKTLADASRAMLIFLHLLNHVERANQASARGRVKRYRL